MIFCMKYQNKCTTPVARPIAWVFNNCCPVAHWTNTMFRPTTSIHLTRASYSSFSLALSGLIIFDSVPSLSSATINGRLNNATITSKCTHTELTHPPESKWCGVKLWKLGFPWKARNSIFYISLYFDFRELSPLVIITKSGNGRTNERANEQKINGNKEEEEWNKIN